MRAQLDSYGSCGAVSLAGLVLALPILWLACLLRALWDRPRGPRVVIDGCRFEGCRLVVDDRIEGGRP